MIHYANILGAYANVGMRYNASDVVAGVTEVLAYRKAFFYGLTMQHENDLYPAWT
jgi:uncharacterized protein YbjQ (UPF0145 family)